MVDTEGKFPKTDGDADYSSEGNIFWSGALSSGLNHIRTLIDREVEYSENENIWGDAFVNANGRNQSVAIEKTIATFSEDKYFYEDIDYYIIVEADSLRNDFSTANLKVKEIEEGKWVVFSLLEGKEAQKRAVLLKLFKDSTIYGFSPSIRRFINITAIKSSDNRDVGKRVTYSHINIDEQSEYEKTANFSNTTDNEDMYWYAFLRNAATSGACVCYYKPSDTLLLEVQDALESVNGYGYVTNPADLRKHMRSLTGRGGGMYSLYIHKGEITDWTTTKVEGGLRSNMEVDFYEDEGIPEFTLAEEFDFMNVFIRKSDMFELNFKDILLNPFIEDWQEGCNIIYRVRSKFGKGNWELTQPQQIKRMEPDDARNTQDIKFNPDGTKMFTLNWTENYIREYELLEPYNIELRKPGYKEGTLNITAAWRDMHFKPDGTKVYVFESTNNRIWEFNLTTPWDITSITGWVNWETFTAFGEDVPRGFTMNNDGTKVYVVGRREDGVSEYDLTEAWNISTRTSVQFFDFSDNFDFGNGQNIEFKPDGSRVYVWFATGSYFVQFDLTTNWDISTIVNPVPFTISGTDGFTFDTEGKYVFDVGSASGRRDVRKYVIYEEGEDWTDWLEIRKPKTIDFENPIREIDIRLINESEEQLPRRPSIKGFAILGV